MTIRFEISKGSRYMTLDQKTLHSAKYATHLASSPMNTIVQSQIYGKVKNWFLRSILNLVAMIYKNSPSLHWWVEFYWVYWDSFLALVNLPVNDFLSPGKETTHVSFPLLFLWNQNVDKQFLFLEHAEEFQEPNSTIQWFIQTNLLSLPPPYIITTTNVQNKSW